jgi:hypothetical protein
MEHKGYLHCTLARAGSTNQGYIGSGLNLKGKTTQHANSRASRVSEVNAFELDMSPRGIRVDGMAFRRFRVDFRLGIE